MGTEKGRKGEREGGRGGGDKSEGGRKVGELAPLTCSQILDHRVGVKNFLGSKQCIFTMYSVVVLWREGERR